MVKNCGDFVHFQIAERNVLGEMVKIVKKKVRILYRLLYFGVEMHGLYDFSYINSFWFFVYQLILIVLCLSIVKSLSGLLW